MATSKVIEFSDEEYNVLIRVRRATVLDGIRRSLLILQARERFPRPNTSDIKIMSEHILAAVTYPSCVAGTESIENLNPDSPKKLSPDLSLEEFASLPEPLASSWEITVYDLNPQWTPGGAPSEAGEVGESS